MAKAKKTETVELDTAETPVGVPVYEPIDMSKDYALVIKNENEVQIICPELPEGAPMTDGHILMLGMVMLLRKPGWASSLIEQTAKLLMESQQAAQTANAEAEA